MKNNVALRVLFLTNGLFVFAVMTLTPIYALFAEDIGADLLTVSYLTATLLVSKLIVNLIMRKFGDRVVEREYMLLAGFIIRSVGWGALAFAGSIPALFIVQVILGISEAVGSPAFNTLAATHLDEGQEIKEYSEWDFITAIAGVAGAIAGGLIVSEFGFSVLFILMSAIAFICFAVIAIQPRKLL